MLLPWHRFSYLDVAQVRLVLNWATVARSFVARDISTVLGKDIDSLLLFDSETKPPRFTALGDGDEQRVYERVEAADPEIRQLAGYVGKYVSEEIPIPYHLALEDGALVLRRLKSPPETLEPTELDTFRGPIGTVRFARDADGTITGFALSTGRIRNLRFGKQ